ncbi:SusC/RagA family TonB-linked outer membrane protein [Pedobacter hiemivivus]|nr:STN domain-containing protein [Pedobacter hiemivivus]
MKMVIIILTTCLMQVSAASFAQKLTYSKKGATLAELFSAIKSQTGFNVFYSNEKLNKQQKVDVHFMNADLKQVLDELSDKQDLIYTIDARNITVKPKEPSFLDRLADSWASIDIRGLVRNEKGEALEGISVNVKGTNKGTKTNANGVFFLKGISENATLIFSGVSIETYEVRVNGKNELNVNVTTRRVQLEEVTVSTGYQMISKERSAGSFSKVAGEAIQQKSVSMNVVDRLEGLVPGLAVNYGEGADKFLVRGVTSVDASRRPLYVLDGTPVSYEDLPRVVNPNDVEDVTILKDATAASIWGAQAANGVIVITTKKGKNSGKIKVNYDGFVSFKGMPDYSYQKMMSRNNL